MRRVVTLATVASLAMAVAGCGTAVPSPTASGSQSPTASASASLVAATTTAPTPTPTNAPRPNTACRNPASLFGDRPYFVSVDADPGRTHLELQVTGVEAAWDSTTRVVPQPRTIEEGNGGILIGGREFTIWPEGYYSGAAGPFSMVAATATMTVEGQAPLDLPVRIVPGNENFDQFAIGVPDGSGSARLDLALHWVDQCFRFAAEASQEVTIVPLATTQACHLEANQWADDLAGLFDNGITVDASSQRLFPIAFNARYVNEGTVGDPPSWAVEWKQHSGGITAAKGDWLEVSDTVKRRHLVVMDAALFRRADALKVANDSTEAVSALWNHRPTPRADGSFRIPVAAELGRYVLVIRFTFTSTCLTGAATSAFSLDVK
jgi:hypothetical protein